MNLIKLSFSYLKRRKLNTILNVLLLSLGVATIVILLLFSFQVENNLYKNADGIDAVVGAKGSPIQLILSSIFHIDAPTGNVELSEAKGLMNHAAVAEAIPLALGDNYRGYRIVGTNTQYLNKYDGKLTEGRLWEYEFEMTLGSEVADESGLGLGDTFLSSHGFAAEGHSHEEQELIVVGVLEPTGTVLDQLILTGVETMWGIHEPHEETDDDHDHEDDHDHDHETEHQHDDHSEESDDHHHEEHTHDQNSKSNEEPDHNHSINTVSLGESTVGEIQEQDSNGGRMVSDTSYLSSEYQDEQITSLLIKYANPLAAAQFPRFVNTETNMQAASPAVEITRLIGLLGVGLDAIEIFAYILILASVLGIFIALINSMKERKYDLAIMRTLGASRSKLFLHVVLEGIIVSMAGATVGIIMGHLAIEGIGLMMAEARQFNISGALFITEEIWIFVLALGVGVIAALIPAIKAYNTEIAETLSGT